MKILNNVVTVAPEVQVVSAKTGKVYAYRPILINGEELGRAFRSEKIRPVNGQNLRMVKWEGNVNIWGLTADKVVKSINQEGKEYQEVLVEGVETGIQAKAFPSKFDVSQARLAITIYPEYRG